VPAGSRLITGRRISNPPDPDGIPDNLPYNTFYAPTRAGSSFRISVVHALASPNSIMPLNPGTPSKGRSSRSLRV